MTSSKIPPDPGLDAVRQRRVSLHACMGRLEVALAAPASGRAKQWADGVRQADGELQECMRTHVAETEAPGGFHDDVLAVAPRLSHTVTVSLREHVALTAQIAALLARAETVQQDSDVEDVRDLGTTLIGGISRHRQRGADMIYEAYQSDLGGQD